MKIDFTQFSYKTRAMESGEAVGTLVRISGSRDATVVFKGTNADRVQLVATREFIRAYHEMLGEALNEWTEE